MAQEFNYVDLPNFIVEDTVRSAKLSKFTVTSKDIRAMVEGIPPGEYVRLRADGALQMSDTPMEKRTNSYFCIYAHGDILIGGLGIGMIILAIQDSPDVNSITVIEKNPDIIELMTGQHLFNNKVTIICGDVFTWKPEKGVRYDTIYMDIWAYINSSIYRDEMIPLKRKYCHYLKPKSISPNRYLACWAEEYAKSDRKLIH